ncbi:MAG: Lrp/AsnC family transcriptional regulator [Pseudomonadota bacterium]
MSDIDPINDKILQELARDGRIKNAELAERVGLSQSSCLRRVQDLERRGIIKGYRAVVDRSAVDRGFVAYLAVGLSDHSKAGQEAFERAIARAPQVVECHNVTGTVEYLLRVEVADLPAYKLLHTDIVGALPQVSSMTSYIVMGSPKDERT